MPVCVCIVLVSQFHNLQELRHSASLANKVFIQRDYSEGTTCKFQTKFPSELESRVGGAANRGPAPWLSPMMTGRESIQGVPVAGFTCRCVRLVSAITCASVRASPG